MNEAIQFQRMVDGYMLLIQARETDPARWHAVHCIAPALALPAMTSAIRLSSHTAVVDTIVRLTASPDVQAALGGL